MRVGVDLTSVAEVTEALMRFGDRYTRRLFTDHEVSCATGPGAAASLAARFSAKEAALKVLAPSGSRPPWRDIEVRQRPNGSCVVHLHARAAALARARGVGAMSVSLSHEAGLAVAVVAAGCEHGDVGAGGMQEIDENRSNDMTMTDEGTERIREVLAVHGRLPVAVDDLAEDDDLFRAGMTSHASVNVMLALEDAFDVEFPEAMLRKSTFASIGALRRALAELTSVEVDA